MADSVSQTQLPAKCEEKSITDLERMLESLDVKLETVVSQLESVKQTRDQLLETTRNLQQKLDTCGDAETNQEQVDKLKAASSEVMRAKRSLERSKWPLFLNFPKGEQMVPNPRG